MFHEGSSGLLGRATGHTKEFHLVEGEGHGAFVLRPRFLRAGLLSGLARRRIPGISRPGVVPEPLHSGRFDVLLPEQGDQFAHVVQLLRE